MSFKTTNNNSQHESASRTLKNPIGLSIAAAGMILGLSGCQSTSSGPVMQRANSTYETTGLGTTKVAAQKDALKNADKTCGRRQPIIIEDTARYNGVLDERTGRMAEQVGSIAGAILGQRMPELSRDDDYEYTITFRCQ